MGNICKRASCLKQSTEATLSAGVQANEGRRPGLLPWLSLAESVARDSRLMETAGLHSSWNIQSQITPDAGLSSAACAISSKFTLTITLPAV